MRSTTEELKLLPCPFCGGQNVKSYRADDTRYAQCATCSACGPDHNLKAHWNNRFAQDPPPMTPESLEIQMREDKRVLLRQRARFHEWAISKGLDLRRDHYDDGYFFRGTREAWWAWLEASGLHKQELSK